MYFGKKIAQKNNLKSVKKLVSNERLKAMLVEAVDVCNRHDDKEAVVALGDFKDGVDGESIENPQI